MVASPGRVALLMPYWDFWETSVPWDLRADREDLLAEACAVVSQVCEVALVALLPDPEYSRSIQGALDDVDAIVIASTMAAPSATTITALEQVPGTPVLVWALSREDSADANFSHTDITTAGSSVGAPMVTSALARAQRRFDVVASSLHDSHSIHRALRRTVTAGLIGRRPLLVIGNPVAGYTSVVPPGGIRTIFPCVNLQAKALAEATVHADEGEVQRRISQIRAQFQVDGTVTEASLTKAAEAEVALRDMVEMTGAVAGALNCHDEALRQSASFGIAPCLALGRLTTDGVPFTCTGDILTAVAMLAVRGLGHPTLYHEIEAIDFGNDEVILANSGEHDLGLCSGTARLVPNNWFTHDQLIGPCAQFSIAAGPASLVAFVMSPEPRFVVAEGEFTGREFPNTGVPNASFRFRRSSVEEAWSKWALAGVTHHSVATSGHLGADIRAIAKLIGAQYVEVA